MFAHLSGQLIEALYIASVLIVSLHGIHAAWLSWLLRKNRRPTAAPDRSEATPWPAVTLQLPIFNERHVVERLIDAVASLDYPLDRLEIQVLDDSTDATAGIVDECARRWLLRGRNVRVVRREQRTGYKAGALAYALPLATGEFICIFDADFLPQPDFLKRCLQPFLAPGGDDIAWVQGRWEHLNRWYSILTRSQALALDGHFGVEQQARFVSGLAFGFNGSAGIWRRAAIEDPRVGGWQADTLCEDLDLSYRAQLAGWRGHFLADLPAPAEIPPQLLAFKRQQARWARGSVQTLRKLAGRVWRSDWSRTKRFAALFHMGNYLVHPMLLLLATTLALLTISNDHPPALLGVLSLASLGPPLLYAMAERTLHPAEWKSYWAAIIPLSMFGIGLSLGNTVAVVKGLRQSGGDFERTPKFRVVDREDSWQSSAYRLRTGWQVLAESAMALLCLWAFYVAIARRDYLNAIYVGLFAASFVTVVLLGLWQARGGPALHPEGAADSRNQDAIASQ